MIDLESIFGEPAAPAAAVTTASPEPAAPAPEVPSPEALVPTAQPPAADLDLDHDAQPEPLDFGPDGWPVGAIEPSDPCGRCGGIEIWTDLRGGRHCQTCDRRGLERTRRWLDGVARARQRWPAGSAPRTAPGRGPAARPTRKTSTAGGRQNGPQGALRGRKTR